MFSKRSVFTTIGLIIAVGVTNYLSLKSISNRHYEGNEVHITGIGETVHVKQMNKLGQIDYTGNAVKVIRYSDGKSRLYTLNAKLYNDKGEQPWYAKSDNAWSYSGHSKVLLWGNVNIWRPKGPLNKPIKLVTSKLTLYPKKDYAETDQFVTISEPGTQTVTTAVGMQAWSKLENVKLLSKVHSIYDAPQMEQSNPTPASDAPTTSRTSTAE